MIEKHIENCTYISKYLKKYIGFEWYVTYYTDTICFFIEMQNKAFDTIAPYKKTLVSIVNEIFDLKFSSNKIQYLPLNGGLTYIVCFNFKCDRNKFEELGALSRIGTV